MKLSPHPYRYPKTRHIRRHAPAGYAKHGYYQPWLEDEFVFRCVYCLKRQVWAPTDIWSADHLIPQCDAPELECDYDNLVLSCQWCNSRKSNCSVLSPTVVAYGSCLKLDDESGEVNAVSVDGVVSEQGEDLIRVLKLNHPKQVKERLKTLKNLKVMHEHAPEVWREMMGYPKDLPNLGRKIPPGGNAKEIEGIASSYYERQRRGELPDVYE